MQYNVIKHFSMQVQRHQTRDPYRGLPAFSVVCQPRRGDSWDVSLERGGYHRVYVHVRGGVLGTVRVSKTMTLKPLINLKKSTHKS